VIELLDFLQSLNVQYKLHEVKRKWIMTK